MANEMSERKRETKRSGDFMSAIPIVARSESEEEFTRIFSSHGSGDSFVG